MFENFEIMVFYCNFAKLRFSKQALMEFNINDVSGSPISKFAFGLIACLICSYNVSVAAHKGDITTGAYVLGGLAFILLLGWLIWFFYMYLGGRKVIQLHPVAGRVVWVINLIIFILWCLSDFFWPSSPVWVICVWTLLGVSAIYYATYCHKNGWES